MLRINKNITWFVAGVLFAILWASASTATKIGLTVAQPMMIAEMRFALAAGIMLFVSHIILKQRLPVKKEWKQLAVYGILNISIYLGLYVIAMQKITAGIGALAVAANPVIIGFLSVIFLKHKLSLSIIISIIVCIIGVVCASYPLLGGAGVSVEGLIIIFLSMLSYSVGSIYFSSKSWEGLSLLTINGWQTLLGGIFLLPVALIYYKNQDNSFNGKFWFSVSWLAILVSIFAVQLWLWLLQINPVRAGLWLFLCPLFGFIIAAWVLNDVISIYTVVGTVLVVLGLLLSRLNVKKSEVLFD
ncbi:MAG: EamA family transporter [Bacteroidetes bacterium]|nr:EamA family transporter [Bacteroidota bacterium]